MAQLMPLPVTVSCFSKTQIGFTFLVLAHPGSPGQRAVKRVCVCVCTHGMQRCSLQLQMFRVCLVDIAMSCAETAELTEVQFEGV